MNKDQIKGIIDEVAGSAKRKAGELTDNPKLEVKGVVQQAKGTLGKAKEAVHDSIEDAAAHHSARVNLESRNATTDADRNRTKTIKGRV